MKRRTLAAAICGVAMALASPALADNLYTSNFGVGPNDGKDGWTVYSPYGQSCCAIGQLIGLATFEIASPVASDYGLLTFSLNGTRNVYGVDAPGGRAPDTFRLYINDALALEANFGLNGGDDLVISNPFNATIEGTNFSGRRITVPFALLFQGFDPNAPVKNEFGFNYSGLSTADSDAYTIGGVRIDYQRGYTPQQSAAPEPATWAMMILGFGLAGGAVRRRRSAAAA